ncbi:TIR domain-containing protein [Blastococcus colisei]|uniref:TIR domain-containing protein n=1 Tax=Blastococcus colisei TaxID=1564162 RepID=A0A543PEH7_9ACTN|nr:toll/interleukin-1 receptor domain-containing protein [Blastococcus colisei]TQN42486.1 TIR domain-containing protein [Blastococcus colisei]
MYRIVMVHAGEDAWAREVEGEVRAAARSAGLPDKRIVVVDDVPHDADSPAAVVYLATTAGGTVTGDKLRRLAEAGYPVVPVFPSGHTDVRALMPPPLERLNAIDWGDRRRVALVVLRALGLGEEDRKLFLSYRRTDAGRLALQLHTALVQRGFDVFLDRFSVDVGVDFQRQIHVDLADKAFVLFIESLSARDSRWVEEEVAYAMRHHISHLALTLPGVSRDRRFPTVDDAFRHELDAARHLRPGTDGDPELTDTALEAVLDMVETRYAGLIRRRREQLLGSLTDVLTRDGYDVVPAADWAVVAQPTDGNGPPRIFLTTVRAPTPRDLFLLHGLREPLVHEADVARMEGVVVHPVADLDAAAHEIVTWVSGGRSLSTLLLNEALDG